ncbi:heat shock factor protein 4 [Anabrus simplex]|uniref:heat shock factor protein 4 n=1 Tax=Anabrus simplex TaxID=316456 RepID=UPI0035A36D00
MHSLDKMGPNVPAFLAKLWKMVEDPETNDLICWSPSGTSFIIRNQARISRELLPVYYKHNNMASFVRQLNMYGFHKVVSIEGGGLKVDKDEMEFAHSCFLMGHPYLLEHIKRKIPAKLEENRTTHKTDLVNKVLSEVKTMKGRQDNVDSQLSAMKRENEVLWREVAILRQKHLKQQQIVNKLIQFLVSMVQSSRNGGLGIKKPYPLMLGDTAHHDTTHQDAANQPDDKAKQNSNPHDTQDIHDIPNHSSPAGPVIHELEATDLPDECIPNCTEETVGSDFLSVDFDEVVHGEVHSPASSSSKCSTAVNLSEPNCDVLLELVEEYPLSPEILTTAAPAEVNPCISLPKNKSKTVGVKNNKKRRSKAVQIKKEIVDAPEVDPLNVGDFLEIVLPNLDETTEPTLDSAVQPALNPAVETTLDPTVETIITSDELNSADFNSIDIVIDDKEQSSLEAATDAAISAIAAAAAASTAAAAAAAAGGTNSEAPEDTCARDSIPKEAVGADSVSAGDNSYNMTLACANNNSSGLNSIKSKEELDNHLGSMQSELDSLRDLLKGEGYSLDANTLLGVCPALLGLQKDSVFKLFSDDPMAFGLHIMEDNESQDQNKENSTDPLVSGGELATYSSNLLDLVDLNSGLDDWSLPETETLENYTNEVNPNQVLLLDNSEFPYPPSKKRRK